MSKQKNGFHFFISATRVALHRSSSAIVSVLAATSIMLTGCATAGEKDSAPQSPPQRNVPTFGEGTTKELSFSNKRLTMVVAVDEDGKIQEFRAPGTKFFTARDLDKHPLKAGSIASFESLSIIKTTNPKICWPRGDGAACCVEWP